jgi:Flp pilus assembly pilin Flp
MPIGMAAISIYQEALMAAKLPVTREYRKERGASSVEYALLVALIAIGIIGGVTLFGGSAAGLFQKTCDSIAITQSTTC